jgi:large subunit ribosomal protein L10
MSLNIDEKKAVVAEVSEILDGAQAAILAEYRGLTVSAMTDLRNSAREAGVHLRVVKNSLAKRAVDGSSFECLQEYMSGPLAYAMSEDPAACAKVLKNFAKDNEELIIKVGAMSGKVLDENEINALAKLPGREELLAKLMGTMKAPAQKFVGTLNAVPGTFVRTLAAVRDSKQGT